MVQFCCSYSVLRRYILLIPHEIYQTVANYPCNALFFKLKICISMLCAGDILVISTGNESVSYKQSTEFFIYPRIQGLYSDFSLIHKKKIILSMKKIHIYYLILSLINYLNQLSGTCIGSKSSLAVRR